MAECYDFRIETNTVYDVKNDCPNKENTVCAICLKEVAKYTCPRCNVGYCSLPCYQSQKHAACSDGFYRDCVLSELKEMNASPQERERVLKMLIDDLDEKIQDNSDEGEGEEEDLHERLKGLDMDRDSHLVWSRLTQKEKEEFARMLQDGRLASLIELWCPWWRNKENRKPVQSITGHPAGEGSVPEIIDNVPDITQIIKNRPPSCNCKFDIINILYCYCFVARVHNGGHMECPVDSAQDLLQVCGVLTSQYTCSSLTDAIQQAIIASVTSRWSQDLPYKFKLAVLEDIQIMISGPGQNHSITFMAAALSDLVRLLRVAMKIIKAELKSEGADVAALSELKSQLFKSEKKLVFLLSWLKQCGHDMHQLLPLLQFELETRQAEAEHVEDVKSLVEQNMNRLKPAASLESENQNMTSAKIVELS